MDRSEKNVPSSFSNTQCFSTPNHIVNGTFFMGGAIHIDGLADPVFEMAVA
jgi:hypothetical protein